MRSQAIWITVLFVAALALVSAPSAGRAQDADAPAQPKIYVPYRDLPSLIDPADKAVLMDRAAFAKLMAAAEANKRADETIEIGQVTSATYKAVVDGQRVSVTGDLTVVSMSDRPVAVALGFGQIGLTGVRLDAKDAPLGYDSNGRLVLIVTGRGAHKLTVVGSTSLTELRGGGMKFGLSVPTATAGQMTLTAPGDLEVHSVSPVTETKYDRKSDKTTARLAVGGQGAVTIVLMGNGRQEDQRAILLGSSATTVQLTASSETLNCLYTVEVLRRGVRELTLLVPAAYTITDVSCPALVKWNVVPAPSGQADQKLIVRLRAASRGTKAMNIQATAIRSSSAWMSPSVRLVDADFEQGHLLVDTGGQLRVRGESVLSARRGDLARANVIPGLLAATQGRLYYHWSSNWQVKLDLASVALRTSCEARQQLVVTPEELVLLSKFDITAIGRELFEMAFDLPDEASQWHLRSVTVNGSDKGFEYRVDTQGRRRVLKVFLASPIAPEGVARVAVAMRQVPSGWTWQADSPPREVSLPMIHARTETVSGQISIAPAGDLDVAGVSAPNGLKTVTVGRMAALGLPGNAQLAWTYDKGFEGELRIRASRRAERISAESIGLVTAQPSKLLGVWRLTYNITRARARTLYLLADKSLGRNVTIIAPGRHLAGKNIVAPGAKTVVLSPELAKAYDLWQLTLDSQTIGAVTIDVRYDRPLAAAKASVPLVRPAGVGQVSEMLALQASEELAVTVTSSGASDVDAIDLPPLPAPASRLLQALRLEAPTTPAGAAAAVSLASTVHEKYEIPSALATEAIFTTYLGSNGSQQTEAVFKVANVGLQFLEVRLPKGAKLWSVRVAGKQARPRQADSGNYLVAMERSTQPREVKVVYAWQDPNAAKPAAKAGRLRLGPAELPGVRINRLTWNVYPPPGYKVAKQFTDMETAYLVRPKLAGEEFIETVKAFGSLLDQTLGIQAKYMAQESIRGAPTSITLGDSQTYKHSAAGNRYVPGAPSESAPRREVMNGEKKEAEEPVPVPPKAPKPKFAGTPKNLPLGTRLRQAPSTTITPPPTSEPAPPSKAAPDTTYIKLGRYTLPVELQAGVNTGPMASFRSLGAGELEISLGNQTNQKSLDWIGMAAVLLAGFLMVRSCVSRKAGFVAIVLVAATVTAIWCPFMARVANGAFYGALWLIPIYLGLAVLGWVWKVLLRLMGTKCLPTASTAGKTAAMLIAILALTATNAFAGGASRQSRKAAPSKVAAPAKVEPLILPYHGDPTNADANADKVLVSYRRYVELWNRANPKERIEMAAGPVEVSLAGVRYAATLEGERMKVVLTARVKTFGKGWVSLPMPMGNLAVQSATLDGKPADLQVGSRGMVLTLPGETSGELKVTALTTPKVLGRRGNISIMLPPLPAAVFTLDLPDAELQLEAPGAEAAPASKPLPGGKGLRWTVPVGMQRKLTLQWSPKVGAGAADRTLSAAAAHDVYALHWALVGVSKVRYTFSAGEYERFGLLMPAEATLTALTGANLRDHREVGVKDVGGAKMKVIEVRLHRPASKAYELTARWVGKLPEMDKASRLVLPQAAEVGRESGTVTLHAAPGMTMKISDVVGGRRASGASARPAGKGGAAMVARYYWPYRPFALKAQLSRHIVQPKVQADQLVRVDRDQVQLLVQARLLTKRGRIYGTSFALPNGYELLSAIGPVVEDHYEQTTPTGRRLHVNFRSGVASTSVALVLVKRDADIDDLAVPTVSVLDAAGAPLSDQAGRLAVQVAASLEAQTISSENLRPVAPRQLAGWLASRQVRAVQFAYGYEKPKVSLRLKISPQKTKVRVEVFGGLTVQATSAWYSYRLRYQIEGTPIDRVKFTLPTRYAPLVAVASPAMRSVSKAPVGGDPNAALTEWTVALVNEVTGLLDVTVNFATPIDAATTALEIPRPSTEAPQGYRAILAVQNASRHELTLARTDRLESLAQSEQAKLLAEPLRRNLQFVYQSFTDDWSAALRVKPAKPAARAAAVVDLMAITTVMDRTGQCRYDVRISLQNRKHQFLRIKVPTKLRLWSAIVAGQPVKPATDPNAPAGVILIPLVKTEPGGLPYDVQLYLAGPAGRKLGLITKIKPPAITVEGIDVARTTWSLRLPTGYRYMNPGGNLSPVVGEIESQSVRIDTLLKQAVRFAKSNVGLTSGKGRKVAQDNWYSFNKKLSAEISEGQRQVEANRRNLSTKDYNRLKQKFTDQSSSQYGLLGVWKAEQKTAGQADNNVNTYLNNDAPNGGLSEIDRNGALIALPDFVRSAAKDQIKNITDEIVSNEARLNAKPGDKFTVTDGKSVRPGTGGKGKKLDELNKMPMGLTASTSVKELLHADGDEERAKQVAQVLSKLEGEQRRNQGKRQQELKSQLSQLGNNRLERYYDNLNAGGPQAQPQAQQMAQREVGRQFTSSGVDSYTSDGDVANGTFGVLGGSNRRLNPPGRPVDLQPVVRASDSPNDPQRDAAGLPDVGIVHMGGQSAGTVQLGGQSYGRAGGTGGGGGGTFGDGRDGGWSYAHGVLARAHGTFSLPLSLPAGGVAMDFQGPGDKPEVSLLAVDERLIDGAHSTAAVLIIALAAWLVWKVGRQLFNRNEPAPQLVAAELLLAAVIAGLIASGGVSILMGVILFGAIVVPVELLHRLLIARRPIPAFGA